MLEFYVGDTKAEVAVVTFDSQVQLFQDFTEDVPIVKKKLKSVKAGDGGAVILDALLYSVDLLKSRSTDRRKVIFLNKRAAGIMGVTPPIPRLSSSKSG